MRLEIFITYYGAPEYLKTAIGSVLEQSDPSWNLTVVDDCFPGNDAEKFINQMNDERLRYIKNGENLGVSETFNRCVELSTADFLVIMGHDDALDPTFVSTAKWLCTKFSDVDIIQPGVRVIGSNGRHRRSLADFFKSRLSSTLPDDLELSGDTLSRSLMIGNWAYFPSLIWRRETLANYRFRADLTICQDLDLISRIVSNGGSMVKNSKATFRYRRHSNSLSALGGQSGEIFAQERRLYSELHATFASKGMLSSSFWARVHPFARLSAFLLAMKALAAFDLTGFTRAVRHAIS